MITKFRIDFDPTSEDDLDRIGAHMLGLRAGGSEPIDSRDNSGTEEMHVHDKDANAELDSITALLTTIDADTGSIDSTLAALSKTEDAAAGGGYQGVAIFAVRNDTEGSLVDTDGDFGSLQLDSVGRLRVISDIDFSSGVADDAASTENPILVGGVAHDAAAVLTALSDDGDKMHFLGDKYRRAYVNDSFNVGHKNTAETVGIAAAEIVAIPMAGRTEVTMTNFGTRTAYYGPTGVTVANGTPIPKNATATERYGEGVAIFMIADAAGQDIRVLEKG